MNPYQTSLPFSAEGYRSIIQTAQRAHYKIVPLKDGLDSRGRTMILRHDIDTSVICALQMAKLEHELGVCSTYFFLTTCDYYNIFNEASRAALHEIAAMGHEIGLHWDSRFLPEEKSQHAHILQAQLDLLGSIVGHEIVSASQHIPTDTPAFDISPYIKFNSYSPTFNKRFTYVSDSSMVWRDQTPLDLVAKNIDVQFLAHPLWWMSEGKVQGEKIEAALKQAQKQLNQQASDFLAYMHKVLADRATYDAKFSKAMARNNK